MVRDPDRHGGPLLHFMDVGGMERGAGPTAHVGKVYGDTTKAD
ncbi:hypothetical protein GCM10010515_58160 [Streptomyces fructofermentans]|uniref:Uncharacterized protein n=1 Tax=Streptomyces fructofermentans TaxID=152141 RepID=A0A918NNC8_9ACTN|nr:hypothetical protein GCM10010515_58160 [Streptomyces fructofermentans]